MLEQILISFLSLFSQKALQARNDKRDDTRAQIDNWKSLFEQEKAERQEAEAQIKELRHQLNESRLVLDTEAQFKELAQAVSSARKNLMDITNEVNVLKEMNKQLTTQNFMLASEKEALQTKLNERETEYGILQGQLEACSQNFNELAHSITNIAKKLNYQEVLAILAKWSFT